MAEPELNDVFEGALAHVVRVHGQGMITLRGDLASGPIKQAVKAVVGLAVPSQRGILFGAQGSVAWMSPDELMVLVPHETVTETLAKMTAKLEGTFHLLTDVSDARACFEIKGPSARDVLAKITPVDLDPKHFAPGQIIRSRVSQVAAAFWMQDDGAITLVCFRSVAGYVTELLQTSAGNSGDPAYYRTTAN